MISVEKESEITLDSAPTLEQEMEEVEENVQKVFFGNLEDIMSSDMEVWRREQTSKIALEEIDTPALLKKEVLNLFVLNKTNYCQD